MDWTKIIAQLQAHGLTQPQIAATCGCGQSTISDLASGKTTDPRDSLGQALRALLTKVQEEAADAAKTESSSAAKPERVAASAAPQAAPVQRTRDHREPRQDAHKDKPSTHRGR